MKNFFLQHRTFFVCIVVVLVLAGAYCFVEGVAERRLRDVKELHFEALENIPCKVICPVAYAGKTCRMTDSEVRSIKLRKQIPHAFYGSLRYDLKNRDIMLHVTWIAPFFGGQFDSYYEIDSPEVKEVLLNFIKKNEEELQNWELQEWLFVMLIRHKEVLTELGDGDPYVGLERAGVAEWIKEGKDPEAEWAKKYPAGGGITAETEF